MSEAVNSGIDPPDFIKLTRQKPYQGSPFEYKEDELLLGYFPFEDKRDHFFTHYSIFSISMDKKAAQFAELCFLDSFKMETAYFDLVDKWKSLKECLKDLRPKILYGEWFDYYSNSGAHPDCELPDFLRFVWTADNRYIDFMRIGQWFMKIEYIPKHSGGSLLLLNDKYAEELGNKSPIEVYAATFGDHSKKTRTPNRFKT